MRLAAYIAMNAGVEKHPGGTLIDPTHKHLYVVHHRLGDKKDATTLHTKVSGNSEAHAKRVYKQLRPDTKGVHVTHLATKDTTGVWRKPTIKVGPNGTFQPVPIHKWDEYTEEETDKKK